MQYRELLAILEENADPQYRNFHSRLLKNDKINVLGVRVPVLRKTAKGLTGEIDSLLSFPDDYYEVTFIKLTAVSYLGFEDFLTYVDRCVPLIDNWASCDCFSPDCIKKHRREFLPYIEKYLSADGEFSQRFALTQLLHYYLAEEYLDVIIKSLRRADCNYYYVYMAAAWLTAEVLVKFFDRGVGFLQSHSLDRRTHNKAIQKAVESFRLSDSQKNFLKGIKR